MISWLRNLFVRRKTERRAAEEDEFFDAWDDQGWPDYDAEGNEIWPVWDDAARKWIYAHRERVLDDSRDQRKLG